MSDRSTASSTATGAAEAPPWARAASALRGRAHALGAGALGLAVGWGGTSPAGSRGINWDTAAYIADLASGRAGFSSEPWSSHFALGPVYLAGIAIARAAGGTALDGARLLTAVALAASTALVAAIARRVCGRRDVALAAAAAFVLAWGSLVLTLTWEDNVLFLPFGLGALAISVARHGAWNARAGVLAGLLVGAGTLVSWQAAIYAAAPLYAAAVLGGPGRGAPRRATDAALVLVSLIVARVAWGTMHGLLAEGLPVERSLRVLFARPEPSFLPDSLEAAAELARRWRTVLRHVGLGLLSELGPGLGDAPGGRRFAASIGGCALAAAAALFAIALRRARRTGRAAGHLLAAALFLMLLATAGYVDLPTDKHKRYDFLPPMAALLLAAGARSFLDPARPRRAAAVLAAAGLLVAAEGAVAWRAVRAHRAALPHLEPAGYHARDGLTWFAALRRLRRETPAACGYLFALDELRHARFQLEIQAALWSELVAPVVVGDPALVADWPRPLPVTAPAAARAALRRCDHPSPRARAALDAPSP